MDESVWKKSKEQQSSRFYKLYLMTEKLATQLPDVAYKVHAASYAGIFCMHTCMKFT